MGKIYVSMGVAMLFSTFAYADNILESAANERSNTSRGIVENKRVLPKSVVKAVFSKDLQSTTNITWQGKDTILHSGDIAKSMLQVPGFSMTRKGGGGSEVIFRSQVASRLPIFLNSGVLNGACGGRMDTTTTYIFPENYNRITFLKGPQDVRYGALISGGLLFERDILRLGKGSFNVDTSAMYGSFNRFDINANALAGGKYGSLQAIVSHYESADYRAGDRRIVHSAYNRESASLIGTFTPTSSTALEFDIDIGRGWASYADRAMDARTFDRISYNLALEQHINDTFDRLDVRLWHNAIDHIMDNFSHLPPQAINNNLYNISNPKRTNTGGRVEGRFYFGENVEFYVGSNYNHDSHESRNGGGATLQDANNVLNQKYNPNFTFKNLGFFTQGQYHSQSNFGIAFGARYDYLVTERKQLAARSAAEDKNNLASAFVRYEHYLDKSTLYAGLGVAQRGADFWERSKANGMNLSPETNTQFDVGLTYQDDAFKSKVSAYASHMANYILINYIPATASAFNTDAFLAGGEVEAEYIVWDSLHFYGSLAYTYGLNLSTKQGLQSHSPLPQVAPLQAQISSFYENGNWLLRLDVIANAVQNRYAFNYGNVVGKDLGNSKGFVTLNLYGGYKHKYFMLLAGVDNLTNTLYAYHLSKNGIDIGALDIAPTTRIYEPGRSIWTKMRVYF